MFESDIVAYTVLGVSLSVSVIQICHWLLDANPRAVLNAGQWSAVQLVPGIAWIYPRRLTNKERDRQDYSSGLNSACASR
jgi:hypothetical protein